MSPTERTIRALQALEREVRRTLKAAELAEQADQMLAVCVLDRDVAGRFQTLLAEIDAARAAVRAERRRALV